jgi:hypothetical protein
MQETGRRLGSFEACLLGICLWVGLCATAAVAELPPEGRCPDYTGGTGGTAGDAGVPLLREGDVLTLEDLMSLAQLFPEEVWAFREAFFYSGMRMEIGFCHRRYPVARFYGEATERYAPRVELDEKNNLGSYVAGLPFPPDSIAPDEPQAAEKWAWNFAHRYRGAGPSGRFRIVDMPSRIGSIETYVGEFFWVRTGNRADLAASGYQVPESKDNLWVAGGRFDEPFNARHLAWRQMRPDDTDQNWKEPDNTFVYVPSMRKPRRSATAWVDGIYTPRYTVTAEVGGGGVPIGTGEVNGYPRIEGIAPTAGLNIQASEHIRKGFVGLTLRPNAYEWTLMGQREVLAPLNAAQQGWPDEPDRNYGPTGLSVASDRWDLRYAVVIRGVVKRKIDEVAAVDLWIDYQTQQPLYFITRRENGLLLDIGILLHEFSSDRAGYPAFPGGELANVFDPVAASFYYVPGGGSGWRRESYEVRSLPADPATLRKMTTTDELLKGH